MAFDAAAGNGGDNTPDVSGGGDSFNPAWNPIMEKLPSEFHNMIAPTLKEWDSNFQRVQTQFSPYKQFADSQVTPDQINASLQLAQVLQTNPRLVYDKMIETYGDEWGLNQVQGQQEEFDPNDDASAFDDGGFNPENHPMFQQMQQQMGAIAQFQQAQIENQERQRINAEIDRDFKSIGEKFGELTQDDISMIAAVSLQNEIPLTQAADRVFSYKPRTASATPQNNSLPNVVPPGGGMPSQAIDPTKLTGVQTRDVVAKMMQQMLGDPKQ